MIYFYYRHKVLLRFGHAENMFPLVSAMGLFKDENTLRHNNYDLNLDRKFKSARMSPFAANMAFVLHKCNANDKPIKSLYDRFKVNLLVNEMPIELYGLSEKLACAKDNSALSVCDFKHFKQHVAAYLNDNFDDVCTPGCYQGKNVSKGKKPVNLKQEL